MARAAELSVATEDAFLHIEPRGLEQVPDEARHGRPAELFGLWAGAFTNWTTLLTASLLTTFFGLGLWDGLLAVVLGSAAGALILGLLSVTGPRSGLPQLAFSQRVFGPAGTRIAAFGTLILSTGWFAVGLVISAQAGQQLLGLFGVRLPGNDLLPWVLLAALLSVVVAIYGHKTIQVFETWGAGVFMVLTLGLFLVMLPQLHWDIAPAVQGGWGAYAGAFMLGFMINFGLIASWYPYAGDYSRYLPRNSSGRAITLAVMLGILVPMALLGLFGLMIPSIDPGLAADPAGGPLVVVVHHTPAWVAAPFLLLNIAGLIWGNYMDIYTAGMAFLTLGVRIQRWQSALAMGVLSTLVSLIAVLVYDFHTLYQQFLSLTYLWCPAWAVIVLISVALAGFGRQLLDPRLVRSALLAWLLGSIASVFFVNYPNLFPGVHAFNQPLIDALRGADLSGLVSVGVAGGGFLLMAGNRLRSRPA